MAYITVTCPSCGSRLNAPEGMDSFYCQYCGSQIEEEKQVVEVNLPGVATTKTMLERVALFLEDGNFPEAVRCLDRVLDGDPTCVKAYIGRVLCTLGMRSISSLYEYDKPIAENPDFQKAVRFASPKTREQLDELAARTAENFNRKYEQFQEQLRSAETAIEQQRVRLQNLAEWHLKKVKIHRFANENMRPLHKFALIAPIFGYLFGITFATSAYVPCLVVAIMAFSAILVLLVVRKRAAVDIETYENEEIELTRLERERDLIQSDYDFWMGW